MTTERSMTEFHGALVGENQPTPVTQLLGLLADIRGKPCFLKSIGIILFDVHHQNWADIDERLILKRSRLITFCHGILTKGQKHKWQKDYSSQFVMILNHIGHDQLACPSSKQRMPAFFHNFGQNPMDLRIYGRFRQMSPKSSVHGVQQCFDYTAIFDLYAHIDGSQVRNITGGPTAPLSVPDSMSSLCIQFELVDVLPCTPTKKPYRLSGSIISCLSTQHYINHSESRVPQKSSGSGFTTVFPIKKQCFFSRALTFIKPIVCCLLYPIKNLLSMISYIGYYKWFVISY